MSRTYVPFELVALDSCTDVISESAVLSEVAEGNLPRLLSLPFVGKGTRDLVRYDVRCYSNDASRASNRVERLRSAFETDVTRARRSGEGRVARQSTLGSDALCRFERPARAFES